MVILVGLPGSGKSYLAERLARKVSVAVLESDRVRKSLIERPVYSEAEHSRVFSAIYAAAREFAASGRNVIIDATNLNRKWRAPLRRIAGETGARFLTVYMATPRLTARDRLEARTGRSGELSDADWSVYQMLEKRMETPGRPDYVVTPESNLSAIIDSIAETINKTE